MFTDNTRWLMEMLSRWFHSSKDEKGQTLTEYVLIVVLIAILVILMLTAFGGSVNNQYSVINSSVSP